MTDDELERIKTKKDKTIHILQFAKMSEVNMIYYEQDYYAIPEAGAEKAFELLRQSLLWKKKVAIAKTVMGINEKLLVLYPLKDGMIVKTLFYHDEIAAVPKQIPKMKLSEQELEMAKMLIQNMTQPFDAESYRDEYQARLREAIMKKNSGTGNCDSGYFRPGQCNRPDGSAAEISGSDEKRTGKQKEGRKRIMDLFQERNLSPMMIASMQAPFDSPDWIYELKLDGCRCIAYLDGNETVLRNKRNMELLPRFPELNQIHRQVKQKCVLDGELVVMVNGVPDFYELQKRTLLTRRVKIELGAGRLPASFCGI